MSHRNQTTKFSTLIGFCAALVMFAGCVSIKKSTAPPITVKVITYNIRAGNGTGDKSKPATKALENIPLITDFINNQNADIVFLQEVDQNVQRSGNIDEAALIQSELKKRRAAASNSAPSQAHAVFAHAIPLDGGNFGVAIISRWPIEDIRVEKLFKPDYSNHQPPYPDYYDEQRVALVVHVMAPGGKITAICTHLGLTNDQREKQLQQIADIVKSESPNPIIFAGDLNAKSDEPELSIPRSVLLDVADQPGTTQPPAFTFPWDKPDRRIDYIFTSPEFKVKSVTVPEMFLSDHRPVVAELSLTRPTL